MFSGTIYICWQQNLHVYADFGDLKKEKVYF